MIKVIKGYQREMRWLLNLRLEKNTSWLIFCKGHLETTDLGVAAGMGLLVAVV